MQDWASHFELMRENAGRLWSKLHDGEDPTLLLLYYRRHRMFALPAQLRKIVACLHLEGSCGVQELALSCRFPQKVVSAQLQRLARWQYVSRLINQQNRRRSVYRISDPILDNALLLNYHPAVWKPLDADQVLVTLSVAASSRSNARF